MNPTERHKPLLRSLTYWSGLVVIYFLAWVWWDSMGHASYAAAGRGMLRSSGGCVEMYWLDPSAPGGFACGRNEFRQSMEMEVFTAPAFVRGNDHHYRGPRRDQPDGRPWTYQRQTTAAVATGRSVTWLLMIPHWIAISAVVAGWLALLLRRSRRHPAGREAGDEKEQEEKGPPRQLAEAKPLHLSFTFWCGLFVILWVCLKWWDSTHAISYTFSSPYHLGNGYGLVSLGRQDHTGGSHGGSDSARESHKQPLYPLPLFLRGRGEPGSPDYDRDMDYRDEMREKMRISPPDHWLLMIPHWLILLALLLPWSALLFWRSWRIASTEDEHARIEDSL